MDLRVYPTYPLVLQNKIYKALEAKSGFIGETGITFEIFVDNCLEELGSSLSMIGDFKKNIILLYIMEKLKTQGELKFFHIIRPGYVQSMGELIGEFKRQGLLPDDIDKVLKSSDVYHDIFRTYEKYQDFLLKNGFYDKEDRYLFLKKHIRGNEFISQYDKIYFVNFYGFTPIQKQILGAIQDKVKIYNKPLMSEVKEVKIIKARDRKTEVWRLAQEILKDLEKGILPFRTCIVLRKQHAYISDILEVFEKLKIPVALQSPAPLIQNPFIQAIFTRENPKPYFEQAYNFEEGILEFLQDQGYPEKFYEIHKGNLGFIKRDLECFKVLLNLVEELEDMRKAFIDIPTVYGGFTNILDIFLKTSMYNFLPKTRGIWILTPTMMRGLSFEKVYTLGMIEEEFPRAFRPNWLLKEEDRARLNGKGYEIDTVELLLKREKESFNFILASAKEIYFSYPELVDNGTPTLASSYLESIQDNSDVEIEKVDFPSVYVSNKPKNDNIVKPRPSIKTQIREMLSQKPMSISALNIYGQCPHRFFLGNVVGLKKQEMEYSNLDRGIIFHTVLEKFFRDFGPDLEEELLENYRKKIFKYCYEVVQNLKIEHLFAHPRLMDIELRDICRNLISYVEYHVRNCGDFKPYLLEYGFGFKEDFTFDFLPDIRFRGRIDRIDINSEGKLLILDYKNSSTPDVKAIYDGIDLQMPFYIMVTEKLLKREVLGGIYVSMKKGRVDNILVKDRNLPFVSKRRTKGIFDEKGWDELFSTTKGILQNYIENILDAHFPITPKKCPKIDLYGSFCDFTDICPLEGEI